MTIYEPEKKARGINACSECAKEMEPAKQTMFIVVGQKVRRRHPFDGTLHAGQPTGRVLTVLGEYPHIPSTVPTRYCTLSDGTWEFSHNLIKEA